MADLFDELLVETGITFVPPEGCSLVASHEPCAFKYHRAYRHPTGPEVRFRIDSLRRIEEGMTATMPDNFSVMAFVTMLTNLGGGNNTTPRQWHGDEARQLFGADWVAVSYFRPVDPLFAPRHDMAALHYLHRDGVADVVMIALFTEGTDGEQLVLGTEPPICFAGPPMNDPKQAYREVWDRACALVEGQIQLDGRQLEPLTQADAGRLRQALALFEQAATLDASNAGPMLLASKVHERLGQFADAVVCLRKAHALAPEEMIITLELGAALGRMGFHGEAVPILTSAAAANPSEPRLQCNLGLAQLMSGHPEAAVSTFERLTRLEPQAPQNKKLLFLALDVADGRKPVPKTEREVAELM
jgi:hypothetical protein